MGTYATHGDYLAAIQEEIDCTDWPLQYAPIKYLADDPKYAIKQIHEAHALLTWGGVQNMPLDEQAAILNAAPVVLSKVVSNEPLSTSRAEWAVFYTMQTLATWRANAVRWQSSATS